MISMHSNVNAIDKELGLTLQINRITSLIISARLSPQGRTGGLVFR